MFSKSKIHEPGPGTQEVQRPAALGTPIQRPVPPMPRDESRPDEVARPKTIPSVISQEMSITGNLRGTGEIKVEGRVKGDIRTHLLTVGETALIEGEVLADDVVIHGHIVGTVRGLKVRLSATARVEGDIHHKMLAIESGAGFEGSVHRQDDPLGKPDGRGAKK
jgi:cytoskeletal protein CcmA (bactofilin family)